MEIGKLEHKNVFYYVEQKKDQITCIMHTLKHLKFWTIKKLLLHVAHYKTLSNHGTAELAKPAAAWVILQLLPVRTFHSDSTKKPGSSNGLTPRIFKTQVNIPAILCPQRGVVTNV